MYKSMVEIGEDIADIGNDVTKTFHKHSAEHKKELEMIKAKEELSRKELAKARWRATMDMFNKGTDLT